jgi:hypothetical protein
VVEPRTIQWGLDYDKVDGRQTVSGRGLSRKLINAGNPPEVPKITVSPAQIHLAGFFVLTGRRSPRFFVMTDLVLNFLNQTFEPRTVAFLMF